MPFENSAHPAAVLIVGLITAHSPLPQEYEAECRSPANRQKQRGKQRHRHGDRQRPEEASGHACDRNQWQEDDNWRDRRSHQRNSDLV